MSTVSINKAAKLVGVSDKTVRRKVASGELSYQMSGDGSNIKLIEISELIRVFGSIQGHDYGSGIGQSHTMSNSSNDSVIAELRDRVSDLKVQINQLSEQVSIKDDQLSHANSQIRALLPSPKQESSVNTILKDFGIPLSIVIGMACLGVLVYLAIHK